jgi:hypothetical protein
MTEAFKDPRYRFPSLTSMYTQAEWWAVVRMVWRQSAAKIVENKSGCLPKSPFALPVHKPIASRRFTVSSYNTVRRSRMTATSP